MKQKKVTIWSKNKFKKCSPEREKQIQKMLDNAKSYDEWYDIWEHMYEPEVLGI